ncbi:thermonuclease family protein (plasmid) [Pseudorhodobacter turbinis]|uniref:Thermonuclease family protein n=2 Tax=Pseudorhodobacter turbinis TaxID=2500533 RepID=A0A4V1E1F6_9RHOB|nr:thermonuclease family protein [Pseudorhodobacter turbinis]
MIRTCLVLLLGLAMPTNALALSGQVRVVDGDGLVSAGERIRLHGIDAPELRQRCDPSGRNWKCGAWAAEMLAKIIAKGELSCEAVDHDRYGRTVARCSVSGRDVGAQLVRAGAAMAYRRYSSDYIALEDQARAQGRGLWSGEVTAPAEYRKTAKRVASAAPSGCKIKGNISAKGTRIYHVPGQRHYLDTRISPNKGEAYFCTETEARAAGFRRSKR